MPLAKGLDDPASFTAAEAELFWPGYIDLFVDGFEASQDTAAAWHRITEALLISDALLADVGYDFDALTPAAAAAIDDLLAPLEPDVELLMAWPEAVFCEFDGGGPPTAAPVTAVPARASQPRFTG